MAPAGVRFEVVPSAIAYARLMDRLRELDGELRPNESDVIRCAADARFFGDPDAVERLLGVAELFVQLQEDGRISSELAEGLHGQLRRVRPPAELALA
jgi:hypothetical protein